MEIKPNPSLAVIIPVFNEAKALPDALTKLNRLSMNSADSIIFVDGGSTDQSREIIQRQGYTCLQSAPGRAKQMNFGTKNSRGDIVLYLHVDTSISSSNISSIKKTYIEGFLSGRFNIRLSNSHITYCIISFFINLRSRMTKISTGDQGIFVRRDIFNKIGGFPEITLMEDIAISHLLKKEGKVSCLKNKLETSSRRWEQHGLVKTVMLMWKLRLLYWLGVSPNKLANMYRNPR
ncbi:MAG: TIGR04283 family arsenosugar biosynthesis glycosyltransferase [Ghiorsea sp.]